MPISGAIMAMCGAEFLLWVGLGLLFRKKALHNRFPAVGAYLGLHVISVPFLFWALFESQQHPESASLVSLYTYAYFATYILSAILLFFICAEVFRSALAPFPGLSKIGIVLFRWAALISVIVSLTSISAKQWGLSAAATHGGVDLISAVAYALMHSASILELCLLAFLCLGMNALRLSVRDMGFGFALGFGLMAASEFIVSSLISFNGLPTAPLQYINESMILAALAIWLTYCLLPEPASKPVVMPVTSRIYRWNEIASALGHTGTQVAVQQPANSFFLTDVEKVVEKVLSRNLKSNESESQS
jgi:hypothetical protein